MKINITNFELCAYHCFFYDNKSPVSQLSLYLYDFFESVDFPHTFSVYFAVNRSH